MWSFDTTFFKAGFVRAGICLLCEDNKGLFDKIHCCYVNVFTYIVFLISVGCYLIILEIEAFARNRSSKYAVLKGAITCSVTEQPS